MKIKVVKGSEVFDKLTALIERCQACNAATKVIADELGAKRILTYNRYRAGGVDGFLLPAKPEGWKQSDNQNPGYYFPKVLKANKALLERIYALPKVTNDEFNAVIGFQRQSLSTGEGILMLRTYGLTWGPEVCLIEMTDGVKFDLLPGMEEIKSSEYMAILAQLEKAKEEEAAQC